MRHHVHLLIGESLTEAAMKLPIMAARQGSATVLPFITTLHLLSDDKGKLSLNRINTVSQPIEGIEGDEISTKLFPEQFAPKNNDEQALESYIFQLQQSVITIDNPGDSPNLLLTITVPLWDEQAVGLAISLTRAAYGSRTHCDVDIIALFDDFYPIINPNPNNTEYDANSIRNTTLAELERLTDCYGEDDFRALKHIVPLQSSNEEGFAIGFDYDATVRVLTEWSLLCVENYNEMIGKIPYDDNNNMLGIGIAALHLDPYYFTQYLMRKAYLYVLNREGVMQENVNVDKIAPIAQRCFKDQALKRDFSQLFEDFWNNKVLPELDNNADHNKVIATLSPKVQKLFNEELFNILQEYIGDESLSLPERKSIMALVLGQDDSQLVGNIFNNKQLNIDDFFREPLKLFVNENNRLKETIIDDDGNKSYNQFLLKTPLNDEGDVLVPIDDIRILKDNMRNSTRYIRQQAKHIDDIKKNIDSADDSELRLTTDGFIFENRTYRLLSHISEKTFEEDYIGHGNLPKAVDLRSFFTPVRDQGKQGACSAFATVAVVEYMLSKIGKSCNLSEAFVYYNARKNAGTEQEDSGMTIHDSIVAAHDKGICNEELCPYDVNAFADEPSQEAIDDGIKRRIATAKNVRLKDNDIQENVELIKSAIADGLPVVVGLTICNSFKTSSGFVLTPSEQELTSNAQGFHAMVVCGYSDTQKFLIVRNSWGNSFGDKGYCYIPYSYLGNKRLCQSAVVITELLTDDHMTTVQPPTDTHKQIDFDQTDASIDYVISSNLLDEERHNLEMLEKRYTGLKEAYSDLLNRLCNQANRQKIAQASVQRLGLEAQAIGDNITKLHNDRQPALKEHKRKTKNNLIKMWIVVFVSLLITGLFAYFDCWRITTICGIITGIEMLIAFLYYPYRKKQLATLDKSFKDEIGRLATLKRNKEYEMGLTKMKMHFAGLFIENGEELRSKLMKRFYAMESFLENLRTWHTQEQGRLSKMDPGVKVPFASVLENNILDSYFDNDPDAVTKEIKLAGFFANYVLNADGIRDFNKKLRSSIANQLFAKLQDFSMTKYVLGQNYSYLPSGNNSLANLVPAMEKRSCLFVQITKLDGTTNSAKYKYIIAHSSNDSERINWQDRYRQYFQLPPMSQNIESKYKMLLVSILPLNHKSLKLLS